MTIITHNIDGGRVSKTYEQMSKEDKSGVVLKLIIQENNSIRNVGQTMIEGCRDLLIKFSEDIASEILHLLSHVLFDRHHCTLPGFASGICHSL